MANLIAVSLDDPQVDRGICASGIAASDPKLLVRNGARLVSAEQPGAFRL